MSLTVISNEFSNTHIEASASYVPVFVSKIANYITSQFLLLFVRPSYERNYYNLTNHLFVKANTSHEETAIYTLLKAISEAKTPESLKTVQKMVYNLKGKNYRCILTQALYIAKSKAHPSVKDFIQSELKKVETDKNQNMRFIPTPDRTLGATLIRAALVGGAVLLVGGLVYYGYSTGFLGRMFSFGASNVDPSPTILPPAVPSMFSANATQCPAPWYSTTPPTILLPAVPSMFSANATQCPAPWSSTTPPTILPPAVSSMFSANATQCLEPWCATSSTAILSSDT